MTTMTINGTKITITGVDDMRQDEAERYLQKAREQSPGEDVTWLHIAVIEDGSKVSLDWSSKPPQFQRIRRITGYFVGTIDRWNNAKRAEEHDRVKHGF